MEVGDELKCRLSRGGSMTVTLDDRVYPDRSCGQYEAGWWVTAPYQIQDSIIYEQYFLSEAGILYAWSGKNHDVAIGYHVPFKRRMREMEADDDDFATEAKRDDEINRSFDAYR